MIDFRFINSHRKSKILWLDLGKWGALSHSHGDPFEQWQDHGVGLLRTILHKNKLETDLVSMRRCRNWGQLRTKMRAYDMLLMNIRSHNFEFAAKAARIFKEENRKGLVLVGGVHTSVATEEVEKVLEFDKICKGPGEEIISDLVRNPDAFPRVFSGKGSKSMANWPRIDRKLWPKIYRNALLRDRNWPLEPECGWGPAPVATILTNRTCPWRCVFCNENSYIPNMGRKPVDDVIEELNFLDERYGPLGSVVIHDSNFFENPKWLNEWLKKYPKKANKKWPYWAAARSNRVHRHPDLFEALIRKTNWMTISIGFESGSDRMLEMLNKECTEADNRFTIELVNRLGDDLESQDREAPALWANIMFGIPGETMVDAMKTVDMMRTMKRVLPSVSYYAPYPGTALGYQLIAEGKSLILDKNYDRFPGVPKVKGTDYSFYDELLSREFEPEAPDGPEGLKKEPENATLQLDTVNEDFGRALKKKRSNFYLFKMKNGKKKLAYGTSLEKAISILSMRLSKDEMREIVKEDCRSIHQRDLMRYLSQLG